MFVACVWFARQVCNHLQKNIRHAGGVERIALLQKVVGNDEMSMEEGGLEGTHDEVGHEVLVGRLHELLDLSKGAVATRGDKLLVDGMDLGGGGGVGWV